MKTYTKEYQDPHEKLKEELTLLLATALASKRKLILEYAADNGTEGLLDYADTILDAGWSTHFDRAAEILAAAAVDSALDTLDASGSDYSDGLVSNIGRHHDLLSKQQAASLLGLQYDHTHDVAIPTLLGWSLGGALLDSLTKVHEQAVAEEWPSEKLDSAITEMSAFGADKAQAMAHNALILVSGQVARTTAHATGASEKFSETVHDDRVCEECIENEKDGWIPINDDFSGSETKDTPHHPRCRCRVSYKWMDLPVAAYSPDQPRDKSGEWSSGGDDIQSIALKNHGETRDVNEAGFVLNNGKMLKMSTRPGERNIVHDAVQIPKGDDPTKLPSERMISSGAIRIADLGLTGGGLIHADSAHPITFEQRGALRRVIEHHNGNVRVVVEKTSPEGARSTVHDRFYDEGTGHAKIVGDIMRAQRGEKILAYSPDQARDDHGRFGDGSATDEGGGDVLAIALKNHGETNDVLRSGYVLPSGKMLNMDPGNTGKRTIDHEDIDIPKKYGESAVDLMKQAGAVRISSDERFGGMIDAGHTPITFDQRARLSTLINHHVGKMYVEVTSESGASVHGRGYDFGTHHTKILGDIARAQRGEKIQSEEAVTV